MKLPFGHGLPHFEKKLSYKKAAWTRNGIALGVFLIIVLIPSLFVALPAFQAITTGTTLTDAFSGSGIWASYWQSLTIIVQFSSNSHSLRNCFRLADGDTYCT